MNAKFRKRIEQWIPEITIILCWVFFWILIDGLKIKITSQTCGTLVGTANNVASIIIGFMGVLVGILFTNNESRTTRGLIQYRAKDLKKYILEPVILGIAVIVFGCILIIVIDNYKFLVLDNHTFLIELFLVVWAGLIVGLLVSSWRIIGLIVWLIMNK